MSRNGSGTYNLPAGNPVVTGTTISSTWANNTLTDIANALTGSLAADGQTTATGALQMGNNKITGMSAGTVAGDAVEYAQFETPTFTGDVTAQANLNVTGDGTFSSTNALKIPVGTTAQRPTGADGKIRYNSTTNAYEGYGNGTWGGMGGAQANGVIYENSTEISANYTMTTGKNGMSVGPITIDSGVTVTVPSGQRWVIL